MVSEIGMKRRYIVASLIFAAAIAAKLTGHLSDWPAVALVITAAVTVLGAHVYDGVSAGPLEIDAEEGEQGSDR